MTLERKVYVSWAFSPLSKEMAEINSQIYEEIQGKATLRFAGSGYSHSKYVVEENPANLSDDELALIADKGNLCFGYRREGNTIIVYTD